MFIKKAGDGNYYICRRTSGNCVGKRSKNQTYRNWFWIKENKHLVLRNINLTFPKEFIGKKIRLKVEVI